ncbi:MAG TPA: glycerophosphodiester phosphodiesterase family protein [Cyclobacteriaceae bacterium]|nr:glycerophosphodiester phosphodiesterase family protein [Cyclobacteriaceae bacterium]
MKTTTLLTLFIALISFSSCQKDPMFHTNKVVAHRGAWKQSNNPQNSFASLKEAVRLGCEGSEFDVWMTKDGVLVANHDPDFMGLSVENSTYQELLAQKLPNGESIPLVEDYLKEGMKQTGTKLVFEIKTSRISKERSLELAENSVMLVKELGAEKWVDYIAFDYDICLKVMELDPSANVAYLNGDKSPEELKEAGFWGLDYNINVMRKNPNWIKEAHDLGLTVNVWTVNKEEDMNWLLDEDIAFITTDEPELLFSLIEKRK